MSRQDEFATLHEADAQTVNRVIRRYGVDDGKDHDGRSMGLNGHVDRSGSTGCPAGTSDGPRSSVERRRP